MDTIIRQNTSESSLNVRNNFQKKAYLLDIADSFAVSPFDMERTCLYS